MGTNLRRSFALLAAAGALSLIGCVPSSSTDPVGTIESAPATADIQWAKGFDEALAQAKAENKPVLVDFFATWCGPCKLMDKNTYGNAQVASELTNWVSVKVDVDQQEALSKQYNIKGIPTTVLISPEGKTISTTIGYTESKELLDLLAKARSGK